MKKTLETKITDALRKTLKGAKINAKVVIEPVPHLPLKRVYVIAKAFSNLSVTERYDFVWRILEDALSREERFTISKIVSLTPEEYEESSFRDAHLAGRRCH